MKLTATILLSLACLLVAGCDDKSPGLTEPNTPVARFITTVTEAASSFLVRITNQSVDHAGGTLNLSYLFVVEQQDNTTSLNPEYVFTYRMLGMDAVGDEAIRRFILTVTEGRDASRTSQSEQNILFQRTKNGVTASAIKVVHRRPGSLVYEGDQAYSGGRFYGRAYEIEAVLLL